MITKQFSVILFLAMIMIMTTFSTYHFSAAQINSNDIFDENNIDQPITPTSNMNEVEIYDESIDDINNWLIVSGNWTLREEGLHGGTGDNTTSVVNNVILHPLIPEDLTAISTSFKINSLNESTANYASIVHSFIDPENYQFAGINIYNDNVYAVAYDINNGTGASEPSWPGVQTDLTWTPDTLFNVSLIIQGTSLDLMINGTTYYSQNINDTQSNQGYVGLNYGRVQDIDFYNFETRSMNQQQVSTDVQNNITQDSSPTMDTQTILLEGKSLPEDSYIHLYDSTSYEIVTGHIAAKLPCDSDNSTEVNVLVGQAPALTPIDLEYVSALSTPDELCLYHGDIHSSGVTPVTDIAIENNSTDDIDFPDTSSIVISVTEISKLE